MGIALPVAALKEEIPSWSLAQHVKARIGNAVHYAEQFFRRASLRAVADGGFDGVVCGHIHKADLVECDGLIYCNDGDWVESCTAVVGGPAWRAELVGLAAGDRTDAVAVPVRDAA